MPITSGHTFVLALLIHDLEICENSVQISCLTS